MKAAEIHEVFSLQTMLKLNQIREPSVILNHRDEEHNKRYVAMINRDGKGGGVVAVALVADDAGQGDEGAVKARLMFSFGDGSFSLGSSHEENALEPEELKLAKEDKLQFYMLERLFATGFLNPDFARQLRSNDTPTAELALN